MVLPSRRDSGEGASDGLNKSGVGRGWSCYSGVSNMVAAGWAQQGVVGSVAMRGKYEDGRLGLRSSESSLPCHWTPTTHAPCCSLRLEAPDFRLTFFRTRMSTVNVHCLHFTSIAIVWRRDVEPVYRIYRQLADDVTMLEPSLAQHSCLTELLLHSLARRCLSALLYV